MRFCSAPAWSGRMMSHSCFGGGGLGGAVVRGILRMRGSDILDALVVVDVKGRRGRKGEGKWRRQGSMGCFGGGCGLGWDVK
jgi:hypothetical protein